MSDMNVNRNNKIPVLECVSPYLSIHKNTCQRHGHNYLNESIVLKRFFSTLQFTMLHYLLKI